MDLHVLNSVYTFFFFLFGLIIGSFLNVVGLRVPLKESIVHPPSHCPTCERRLTPIELIPVLSYLLQRGKCRGCKNYIRPLYPLMELTTGLLFAWSFMRIGWSTELLVALLLMMLLVSITVSDIAYMLIPNRILLPFALLFLVLRVLIPLTPWWDSLLGAVVGFSILYFIAILSRGGMGGGDIKLFFVIGLVLGTTLTLLTLVLATFIGTFIGLLMLIKGKKEKGKKTPIPFGPAIALATVIAYFWGNHIVEWYMTFF